MPTQEEILSGVLGGNPTAPAGGTDPMADARQIMLDILSKNSGTPGLDAGIAGTRDKITDMLRTKSGGGDVFHALAQAAGGRSSFGEAMNASRATQLNEQNTLLNAFTNERAGKREQRRIELDEARLTMEVVQKGLDADDADVTGIQSAIGALVHPADGAKVWVELHTNPKYSRVNRRNAHQAISEIMTAKKLRPAQGRNETRPRLEDQIIPIIEKMKRGEPLTKGEQKALDYYLKLKPKDLFERSIYAPPEPSGGASNPYINDEPVVFSDDPDTARKEFKNLKSGQPFINPSDGKKRFKN